jgi:hypothetical protein
MQVSASEKALGGVKGNLIRISAAMLLHLNQHWLLVTFNQDSFHRVLSAQMVLVLVATAFSLKTRAESAWQVGKAIAQSCGHTQRFVFVFFVLGFVVTVPHDFDLTLTVKCCNVKLGKNENIAGIPIFRKMKRVPAVYLCWALFATIIVPFKNNIISGKIQRKNVK